MPNKKNNKFNLDWNDDKQVKEYHRQYRLKKRTPILLEKERQSKLFYSKLHNLPLTDIAYIAGLFDGEGCVSVVSGIRKRPGRKNDKLRNEHSLHVSISNQHIPTLTYIKNATGLGNIYRDAKDRINFKWIVDCVRAMEFLKVLLPYLKIKKPQAELAIKLQTLLSYRNMTLENTGRIDKLYYLNDEQLQEREQIKLEIQRLNHSYSSS